MGKLDAGAVKALLEQRGIAVTTDEAMKITKFLKKMATIVVSQYLNKKQAEQALLPRQIDKTET